MEKSIKEIGKTVNLKAKELTFGKMVICMKEIGKRVYKMEKEFLFLQMAINVKGIGVMGIDKVKEQDFMWMGINMKENIQMMNETGKGLLFGLMVISTLGLGKHTWNKEKEL